MPKLIIHKPLKTWQIFHFVKEKFGKEYLLKLWGYRNAVMIYEWCMDPAFTENARPNPIDKLIQMIEDLNAFGYRDIAISIVKLLARPLNLEVTEANPEPTKDILSEFLDIPKVFGEISKTFQEIIADGEITEEEALLLEEAVDELIKEAKELKNALKGEA